MWQRCNDFQFDEGDLDFRNASDDGVEVTRTVTTVTIDRNVQLAAAGDMAAFEQVYQTYHRRVYAHCLRMTRSVAEAEDLTQEVFIQLYRKLKTFRGDSLFTTWLHRLTTNAVLMHFRKVAARLERTTDDDGETLNEFAGGTLNNGSLIDRIALDEAIRQLSPGYRAVFILHDIEGYEHHQISKILGCAVGTSKSQLHKARMKLRRLLRPRKSAPSRGAVLKPIAGLFKRRAATECRSYSGCASSALG
ncbi:MAG TPA: RNA polymerase sigma factor [Pyrinomonadaceae bacterium]|nr:RNA polymerase sigma factor [Pyrinomonadaceae bacterium]